uniref:Uncharacterized protein n=1 Tax=Rhizophora mucronata TaxID=61149 RepID=A0A2P2NCK9_RHIMU
MGKSLYFYGRILFSCVRHYRQRLKLNRLKNALLEPNHRKRVLKKKRKQTFSLESGRN